MSFGFKYGLPMDADIVMDVRFLPNPFYIKDYRPKTGLDPEVYNYVMDNEDAEVSITSFMIYCLKSCQSTRRKAKPA